MSIISSVFTNASNNKECFQLKLQGELKNIEASSLRDEINKIVNSAYAFIYIDGTDLTDINLSGINEIIHTHYTLQQHHKKLIFKFQPKSNIAKWVETTGINKFLAIEN